MKMMAFRLSIPLYLSWTIPGRFPGQIFFLQQYDSSCFHLVGFWRLMVNNLAFLSAATHLTERHLTQCHSYQLDSN